MIFSKRTIRKTSIPKITNIHSRVWKLQAQNSKIGLKWTKFRYFMDKNSPYQNFPSIQSMIFSKRTIRTTSIQKIRNIHSGVWKLQAKNSKIGLKWTKFRYSMASHITIFPAYRICFSQRRPKEQLPYQKLGRFIAAYGSYRPKTLKTVNFGQKMAKFWS